MKKIYNVLIGLFLVFCLVSCSTKTEKPQDTPNQKEEVRSISKIEKTSSEGKVDTYTIFYTDGTTTTFEVTNGSDGSNGINGQPASIAVSEDGFWVINSVKTEFKAIGETGSNGKGISLIEKKSTNGKTDTYLIVFSDGTSEEFTVTNGSDGTNGENGDDGLSAYEIYLKYHPSYKGTEEDWINALADGSLAQSYKKTYNIIFALATIPPVLAALDSIGNGYETYAIIERGKTYNGIDSISNFHNVGFSTSNNTSSGFTKDQFDQMATQIEELNIFGNEKFNIYVQDGTGLSGLGLAMNASLSDSQYEIIMCEDGRGTYNALEQSFIKNKALTSSFDGIYDNYVSYVNYAKGVVEEVKNTNQNDFTDSKFGYHIPFAYALAALDNFTYWIQDENQIKNILESSNKEDVHSKLLSSFGIEGYDDEVEVTLNLKYNNIMNAVSNLDYTQRTNYLTLMYGEYYADTYNTLMRTTLDDHTTPVSESKMVFISTRIKSFPAIASNASYGIGGASNASDIPDNYADLDAKYKTPLLFSEESDYNLFIENLNDMNNYETTPTEEQLSAVRVQCFNYYINYIFILKYTYSLYGDQYDIIMKGHPSEVLGAYSTWTNAYVAASYNYNKLMNEVVTAFHTSDGVGKFIGMVPYGTAAENLAYLGANIAICGLNSSTYTGYDTNVDVTFVFELKNTDITTNSNLNSRYQAGNLIYHVDSEEYITRYDNVGNIYKNLITIYNEKGQTSLAEQYQTRFDNWLKATFNLEDTNGCDIDAQGFLVKSE
ncbi:MAG: hypothetical protein K2J85_00985 [Anaeroplasmataceae bacterium]|nr:hypothetical protein [Anaeroplasmataceae bacterium]